MKSKPISLAPAALTASITRPSWGVSRMTGSPRVSSLSAASSIATMTVGDSAGGRSAPNVVCLSRNSESIEKPSSRSSRGEANRPASTIAVASRGMKRMSLMARAGPARATRPPSLPASRSDRCAAWPP